MNVLTENLPMLLEGTGETLAMVFVSALFAYVIGLPLGVALIVTDKNGLHPMRSVSAVLGWIVNIGRSIPFVILMLVISPLTRLIVGRAYGTTATIVPLVVAAAPFVARMVEQTVAWSRPRAPWAPRPLRSSGRCCCPSPCPRSSGARR